LADFGLAKMMEPSGADSRSDRMTRPGLVMGTIAYMSPEQAAGKTVDARSDIFSFGLVLYEAFTGEMAFRGANELELLNQILHGTPAALPHDVPIGVRMVVEKALEKDPSDRYQTMRDLVVDLRRAARVPALAKALPEESRPRRHRLGIAGIMS